VQRFNKSRRPHVERRGVEELAGSLLHTVDVHEDSKAVFGMVLGVGPDYDYGVAQVEIREVVALY